MGVNLETLRSRVKRRIRVDMADEHLTDIINEALQQISTEHDWPWLIEQETFPTVADVSVYGLGPTWRRTISLTLADGAVFEQAQVDGSTVGFAITSDGLVLSPTPKGAQDVVHRYVKYERNLEDDLDEAYLPDRYVGAVVELACAMALIRTADPRAGAHERVARDWLARMNRESVRTRMASVRIKVRPGHPF